MIILPVELGIWGDFAVEGEGGPYGVFHGRLVDDGETTRHSEADGTDMGVRRRPCVIGGASAEHFAAGQELGVDL